MPLLPLGIVIGSHIWFHIWNVIGFHIWYKTLLLLAKLLIVKLSIKEDSNLPCIVTKLSSAGLLDILRAFWAQFGHYHYYRGRLFAVNLHKKANWRRSEIEQWAPYWWHHLPASLTSYVLHLTSVQSYILYLSASVHLMTYIYHHSVHITSYVFLPQYILQATSYVFTRQYYTAPGLSAAAWRWSNILPMQGGRLTSHLLHPANADVLHQHPAVILSPVNFICLCCIGAFP